MLKNLVEIILSFCDLCFMLPGFVLDVSQFFSKAQTQSSPGKNLKASATPNREYISGLSSLIDNHPLWNLYSSQTFQYQPSSPSSKLPISAKHAVLTWPCFFTNQLSLAKRHKLNTQDLPFFLLLYNCIPFSS